MKRLLTLASLLLLASGAWAQGNTPAPKTPAANAPAPGAPAKPAANAPAANTPAANAPAGNAPAAGAAAKTITVRVPSGGEYTAYINENPVMKTIRDNAVLDVPAGAKSFTVYVLDKQSGYAGRKTVTAAAAPAEISFASPDFRLVQKVQVRVTGKEDRPIAQGIVTLTDGAKNTVRKVIQPSSQGTVDFDFVANGPGTVSVTPEGGTATTKEVNLDLAKGSTVQTIPVALPEVTATVEPAPGAAAPAANAPAANAGATGVAPAPTAAPTPLPPADPGGGLAQTLIGFLFLGALLGGLYLWAKNRGITVDQVLKKLGVQPDTVVQGGGSLAGANLATAAPAPGAAPAPPPVVADPNQCAFCGQMKDASGGCACSALPPSRGAGAASSGLASAGAALGGSGGPRLVGMAGIYMGQVFPVSGSAVIGREATNPVPLDRDTTTSRRHAQLTADGGVYRIQDLGSANGTFVNGARVTDATLNPGDEVSIGGTRFRFEV